MPGERRWGRGGARPIPAAAHSRPLGTRGRSALFLPAGPGAGRRSPRNAEEGDPPPNPPVIRNSEQTGSDAIY